MILSFFALNMHPICFAYLVADDMFALKGVSIYAQVKH